MALDGLYEFVSMLLEDIDDHKIDRENVDYWLDGLCRVIPDLDEFCRVGELIRGEMIDARSVQANPVKVKDGGNGKKRPKATVNARMLEAVQDRPQPC